MMDKNREAFEAWFSKDVFSIKLADPKLVNCYRDAWHASRAAIEIELPEKMQEVVADTLIHGRVMANDMLRNCTKSITSLGIRVKGNEA